MLGPGHAVGGVAWVFAAIESPGVIVHRLGGRLAFGELDGRPSPRLERLQAAFTSAGVAAEVSRHHPRPVGEVSADRRASRHDRAHPRADRRDPLDGRDLAHVSAARRRARGAGAGQRSPPDARRGRLDRARRRGARRRRAVLVAPHDLTQGRRLELEALHGHALRLGQRLGVSTPMLFAVYAALRPHADGPPREARLVDRSRPRRPARSGAACIATASGTRWLRVPGRGDRAVAGHSVDRQADDRCPPRRGRRGPARPLRRPHRPLRRGQRRRAAGLAVRDRRRIAARGLRPARADCTRRSRRFRRRPSPGSPPGT